MIGLMKDELGGKIMKKCVGLRKNKGILLGTLNFRLQILCAMPLYLAV